jgi:hypothetical protein
VQTQDGAATRLFLPAYGLQDNFVDGVTETLATDLVTHQWLIRHRSTERCCWTVSASRLLATFDARMSWQCKCVPARRPSRPSSPTAMSQLLLVHGDVGMTSSIALRTKRTLDGAEIDGLISNLQVRKAMAAEHRRRADWRKRELSARRQMSSR